MNENCYNNLGTDKLNKTTTVASTEAIIASLEIVDLIPTNKMPHVIG
jgi:hypothetical protein